MNSPVPIFGSPRGGQGSVGPDYSRGVSTARRHFRNRKSMMYHEKERKNVLLQMTPDPYLDFTIVSRHPQFQGFSRKTRDSHLSA